MYPVRYYYQVCIHRTSMADDTVMTSPEQTEDGSTLNPELREHLGGIHNSLQTGFSSMTGQLQALREEVLTMRGPTNTTVSDSNAHHPAIPLKNPAWTYRGSPPCLTI